MSAFQLISEVCCTDKMEEMGIGKSGLFAQRLTHNLNQGLDGTETENGWINETCTLVFSFISV